MYKYLKDLKKYISATNGLIIGVIMFLVRNIQRLFKREDSIKRLLRELYNELEPLNQKLKEEANFPKYKSNVLWYDLVFGSAIYVYEEALNCFSAGAFEASTVMCRNAIDSAIYLGWEKVRTDDVLTNPLREPLDSKKTKTKWYWPDLKKQAIKLGLLEKTDITFVEKVREKGHFSAHFAMKRNEILRNYLEETDPIYKAWLKENEARSRQGLRHKPAPMTRGYKQWTLPEEALTVLSDTKNILVMIVQNYFTSEKTLAC